MQEDEPDDTACLKAAYAETPSPSPTHDGTGTRNDTGGERGPVSAASTPSVPPAPASFHRRKRTLASVVKNLHNSKKHFSVASHHFSPRRHPPTPTSAAANALASPSPFPHPDLNLSISPPSPFITTKNINNNNVTIDPNTGLEVKQQQPPPRKKGPFGKKRLTEIVDANANALGSDSASDISLNSSLGGSAGDATCHICNKVLSTKASYKRHMNFHQGIYPHRCRVCDKGFAVKGDLRGHEATHTNEKEFPCPGCERIFAYKKNLQMHMRKKHPELHAASLSGSVSGAGIVSTGVVGNVNAHPDGVNPWMPKKDPDAWGSIKEEMGAGAGEVSAAAVVTGTGPPAWPTREQILAGGELAFSQAS